MKKIIVLLAVLLWMPTVFAQTPEVWKTFEKPVNFILANDLGRNGYYDQKPIAEMMGKLAENVDIACVVAAGDVHHFEGVRSISDPLWLTNYEWIYAHPELMLPWYPILGNHEYRGSTQAVLDYTKVSRRWCMPARYYTRTLEEDGITMKLILLDTPPLIDKYRNDSITYPDTGRQDMQQQLDWLDQTLKEATEDWVIVIGHHPIYAQTPKADSERADMQKRVGSILKHYQKVAFYLCGHIHNFQHIRQVGDNIDYVVNSAASLSRKVKPIVGTQYCSDEPGFSLISADKNELVLRMLDKQGKVLYTIKRMK